MRTTANGCSWTSAVLSIAKSMQVLSEAAFPLVEIDLPWEISRRVRKVDAGQDCGVT
jgi:hypothetical protein